MESMKRRGDRFDLIVVDPFHDYMTSLEDFELSLACLDPHGVLLSHDCAPESVELAEPNYRQGAWCGQTYASLTKLARMHPELAITVLDTDTGVGIVRKRESQLRQRWLPPAALNREMQDRLLALIEGGKFKEAFRFYRAYGESLTDLRSKDSGVGSGAPRVFRKDSMNLPIQDGAYFVVFHKFLDDGAGPAISLYVKGSEILKYDCFGPGKGHYHVRPNFSERLPLEAQRIEHQIQESIRDIRDKSTLRLSQQAEAEIRDFTLDRMAFEIALEEARSILFHMASLFEEP